MPGESGGNNGNRVMTDETATPAADGLTEDADGHSEDADGLREEDRSHVAPA